MDVDTVPERRVFTWASIRTEVPKNRYATCLFSNLSRLCFPLHMAVYIPAKARDAAGACRTVCKPTRNTRMQNVPDRHEFLRLKDIVVQKFTSENWHELGAIM